MAMRGSSTFMGGDRTIVVDIDGTICSQERTGTYQFARPNAQVIEKLRELKKRGWTIVLHTARGMKTCCGDKWAVEMNYRSMTENWLYHHAVPYDRLVFGKIDAVYYIDDKSLKPDEFVDKEFPE